MPKKQKTSAAAASPAADAGDNEDVVSTMFEDDYNDAVSVSSRRQKVESGDRSRTALPSADGIVLNYKKKTIQSGEKIMYKGEMDFFATNADSNGATTLINTGENGEYFLLPSQQMTDEGATGTNDPYKPKQRETVYQDRARVRKISCNKVSVFVKDTDEDLKPGTPVRIEGFNAEPGIDKFGQQTVFLNAKKAKPKGDAPPLDRLGAYMCDFAETPQMQSRACFATSLAMCGYYGDVGAAALTNDAKKAQAAVLHARWENYRNRASASAEEVSRALGGSAGVALKGTSETILELPPEAYAAGEPLFPTESYDDGQRAILTQSGVHPWHSRVRKTGDADGGVERDAIAGVLTTLALGGAAAEALPKTVAGLVCTKVEFTGHDTEGKGLSVEWMAAHVPDVDAARNALAADPTCKPWLLTKGPAVAASMSARPYAHLFGTTDRAMAQMAGKQFFKFGRYAIVSKVLPVQRSSEGVVVQAAWPEGGMVHFDMPATLANFPIVSKAWVVEQMCAGGALYAGIREVNDDSAYKLPEGVSGMPSIKKHGYKELTVEQERSWDVKTTLAGVDEFRVVYDGAVDNVAKDKSLVESTAKGEEHLATLAAALDVDLNTWLKTNCLVYAVGAGTPADAA